MFDFLLKLFVTGLLLFVPMLICIITATANCEKGNDKVAFVFMILSILFVTPLVLSIVGFILWGIVKVWTGA